MSFYERFKDYTCCYNDIIPDVKYHLRDTYISVNGKRISYADLTGFIVKDGDYIPVWALKNFSDNEKVIDFYPLLNIGLAEYINLISKDYDILGALYDELCLTYARLRNSKKFDIFTPIVNAEEYIFSNNIFEIMAMTSIRSSFVTNRNNMVKIVSNLLNVLRILDLKEYTKVLLDVMHSCFDLSRFCVLSQGTRLKGSMVDLEFEDCEDVAEMFKSLKFGKISYTTPDKSKKHYISDGRGLGILALTIFIYHFYIYGDNSFIEDCEQSPVFMPEIINFSDYMNLIQKKFKRCLGDDWCGRYYSFKKVKFCLGSKPTEKLPLAIDDLKSLDYEKFDRLIDLEEEQESYLTDYTQTGIYKNYLYVQEYTCADGSQIQRGLYEDKILFKRAYGVSFNKEDLSCRFVNCYYTGFTDLDHAVSLAFKSSPQVNSTNEQDIMKIKSEWEQESERKLSRQKALYEDKIVENNAKKEKELSDLQNKINQLESLLSSKTNIITQLSNEIKGLNQKLESYYDEEKVIMLSQKQNLSIEDMVTFLNDYTITLVGGRMELNSKLKALGCTGIVQVDRSSNCNGTIGVSDFFCINTRFVSHNLCERIKSRYINQEDCFFYYNGTNPESLIHACYDFVTHWLEV